MKSYKEVTEELLSRRDRYVTKQKLKNRMILRISTTLCCFCLVALFGFGAWQIGLLNTNQSMVSGNSSDINESNNANNSNLTDKITVDTSSDATVIWGDNYSEGDMALCEWEGKRITTNLWEALNDIENKECVFAISAKFIIDPQFVYNGKTLEQYSFEEDTEITLFVKLSELLKLGDSLKYGEALYQTGTPNGEKWIKELYEREVEYFGKELLAKYIVDGEFLKAKVEADMKKYAEGNARAAYDNACAAYYEYIVLETAKQLNGAGINCEIGPKENLIIFLSIDEFSVLTIDNVSIFGLADSNGFDVPTDL